MLTDTLKDVEVSSETTQILALTLPGSHNYRNNNVGHNYSTYATDVCVSTAYPIAANRSVLLMFTVHVQYSTDSGPPDPSSGIISALAMVDWALGLQNSHLTLRGTGFRGSCNLQQQPELVRIVFPPRIAPRPHGKKPLHATRVLPTWAGQKPLFVYHCIHNPC